MNAARSIDRSVLSESIKGNGHEDRQTFKGKIKTPTFMLEGLSLFCARTLYMNNVELLRLSNVFLKVKVVNVTHVFGTRD